MAKHDHETHVLTIPCAHDELSIYRWRRAQNNGGKAIYQREHAKNIATFLDLQERGMARIRIVPDDEPYDAGDCDDTEARRKATARLIEQRGVWGVCIEIVDGPNIDHVEQIQSGPYKGCSVGWIGSLWSVIPDDHRDGNNGFLETILDMLGGFADAYQAALAKECASL